jgi:FkbM family methyltransferase
VGFFAVIAAKLVGETGSVFCFEPLPANARQIEYNAKLNGLSRIVTRCEALGGSDRIETLTLSAEPTWGSLATVGKAPAKACGEMKVNVRMLDSLYREEHLPYPDLMKIDVEGAEQELLCGARETLLAKRPLLVIELHSTNDAVTSVLDELNYDYAVLGSSIPVAEANWDANIIAAPRERPAMIDLMKKLSQGPATV